MTREYEVCIKGISYEEVKRRSKEIFDKLIEKLSIEHGIRLEECEDIDPDIGHYVCWKKNGKTLDEPVEVIYFYTSIDNAVCISLET